jgi:hypothetical protein
MSSATSFGKIDFTQVQKHIKDYNLLFLSNSSEQAKNMSFEEFGMLLVTTGLGLFSILSRLDVNYVDQVAEMLHVNPDEGLSYLQFLSFIPFFLNLHKLIVASPLGMPLEIPTDTKARKGSRVN